MASWHVNPETGEAGRCSAAYKCPFGGELGGHKSTKKEAALLYESYREGLHDADKRSYFYFIADVEGEAFTSGDCGHFARDLHKSTGYPVNAVGIKTEGKSDIEWQHMTVRAPDGRFLDVTGLQPESILKKSWGSHLSLEPGEEIVIQEIQENQIEGCLGNAVGHHEYPNVDSKSTVKRVLEALKE